MAISCGLLPSYSTGRFGCWTTVGLQLSYEPLIKEIKGYSRHHPLVCAVSGKYARAAEALCMLSPPHTHTQNKKTHTQAKEGDWGFLLYTFRLHAVVL